jgi:hypothetical protein
MTSTYSDNKRLELPGYNDYVDSWNIPLNADMTVLDKALGGSTLINATSSGGTVTLTSTQYQPLSIIISGTPTSAVYYTIPSGVGGQWTVTNSTVGAQKVYMVSAAGGSAVEILQGYTTMVSCDGSASGMRLSISTPSLAAGSTGQVQYNNNGYFGANSNFYWDITNNRLGVGTSSPSYNLHVASSGNPTILAENTTSTVQAMFGTSATGVAQFGSANSGVRFISNNSEAVRIDTSGNVGIGTSSPATVLDVRGTNVISQVKAGSGYAAMTLDAATGATPYIFYKVNGVESARMYSAASYLAFAIGSSPAEQMRIGSSGVSIGTTALATNATASVNGTMTFGNSTDYTTMSIGNDFGGNTLLTLAEGSSGMRVVNSGNSAEHLRITSAGNVGIGIAAPATKLDTKGRVRSSIGTGTGSGGAGYALYEFGSSTTDTENWQIGSDGDGTFRFYNQSYGSGIERMRLTADGLMTLSSVSQIQSSLLSLNTPPATNGIGINVKTSYTGIITDNVAATAVYNFAGFMQQGVVVGSIGVSTTSTSYNTSSDYRLKQNAKPITGALNSISALNPVSYTWKSTGERGNGFIAHELQAVIPEAVSGEKDAVNEDGTIKPQGVDYSKIVVHLVAALQELKAEFDAYKAAHP